MRQRTLLDDTHCDGPTDSGTSHNQATYEHVRRTLDEALDELQMPRHLKDESGRITVRLPKIR